MNNYNVPIRLLTVTPTRDGLANPSRRLPDKHTRLFCGKTLDEWTMIQLWSSKYVGRALFVCETEEHAKRLHPLAEKYKIELVVRSKELLHSSNDSGSLVTFEAIQYALRTDYYSILTTPFVISPCRPPGFFDWMVDIYLKEIPNMDFSVGAPQVLGGWQMDMSIWQLDKNRRAIQKGPLFLTKSDKFLASRSQHHISATWWHIGAMYKWFAHADENAGNYEPIMFEIEPWMDSHIDDEEDWDLTEYYFQKKILSKGENCYDEYRDTWCNT